jgi:hypothetical protein
VLCVSCGLSSHCGYEMSKIHPRFLNRFGVVQILNGYIFLDRKFRIFLDDTSGTKSGQDTK